MIRLLKGSVRDTDERTIILFVNGVGYQVFVTDKDLHSDGEEVMLYIHTHVREDDIKLFGFKTKKELEFFELLLKINGVGPKMALEILNEPTELIQNAIFESNLKVLTKVPGVGKKIAERICLELKSKVVPSNKSEFKHEEAEIDEDLFMALENLGYKRGQIKRVIEKMNPETKNTEELIRLFLQQV